MANRPSVTVTYAQSIDGRIATGTGESQWISGSETLSLSQELRRDHQAIAVGAGTVNRDDPALTCRLPDSDSPTRVIFDSRLGISLERQVVKTASAVPTVVVASMAADVAREGDLRAVGVEVVRVKLDERHQLSLGDALAVLAERGVGSLLVEGGGKLITSFLRDGFVDRLIVVTAPLIIGAGVEAVGDLGVAALSDALRPRTVERRPMGEDLVWELTFR